jgi:hypothetical protein
MESARGVGRSFSPLDEELGLLEGALSPYLQEQLTRLGTWIPSFARAAALLEVFTGAYVSAASMRRHTEEAGAVYEQHQAAEVKRLKEQGGDEPQGPEKLVISADGAMVPLVGGKWEEVKTLVIGEPRVVTGRNGERVVKTEKLSYFSRVLEAEAFQWQALVETHRRGVATAGEVGCLADGAGWIQGFADFHRPDARRILDLPHAGGYVYAMGQALYGEGTPEAQAWWQEQMQTLKAQGAGAVLPTLETLTQAHPQLPLLEEKLAYLRKREDQMQYPTYQAEGWPIGSGIVESANKLVVEERLKGSGMRWAPGHVNPLLGLRNVVFNDRWDEAWLQITGDLRQQTWQRRLARQRERRGAQALGETQTSPPLPEQRAPDTTPPTCQTAQPDPVPAPPTATAPSAPQPRRPAPDHPWRHSPIGKARFEPHNAGGPPKL